MEEKEVNEILKKGSVKRKTLLYFYNIALSNTTGINASLNSKRKKLQSSIITLAQSESIRDAVKTKKDKDFFNKLIHANKVYTGARPHIESHYLEYTHASKHLQREIENNLKEILSQKANDIIIKLALDKLEEKDREEILLEKKKIDFRVNTKNDLEIITGLAKLSNKAKLKVKAFAISLDRFLEIYLPLEPYFDYIEDLENLIEEREKEILTLLEKRNKTLHEIGIKPLSLELENYRELEYKIDERDLEQLILLG